MRKSRILATSAALVLTMTGIFAPASHSALISGRDWVATPNGLVGVQQMVIVRASGQAGAMAVVTFQNTSAGINAGQAAVNSQGFAYLPWQPGTPGAWNISATVGGSAVGTASIVVTAMPTTTTLLSASQFRSLQTATLVAQVRNVGGEITPSGTIAVRDQNNNIVVSGTLSSTTTPGLASANIAWTPSGGSAILTATYTPDTNSFVTSTSPVLTLTGTGGLPVTLRLPQVSYLGVTETIEAVIQPIFQSPLGGSVAFSLLNIGGTPSFPMGGSRGIGNGVGSTTWTPSQIGRQTVVVEYAAGVQDLLGTFAITGTNRQIINVLPAPTPDSITMTPAGASAWGPGVVGTLTAGNSVALTPAALSGNPVPLSTDGPCVINAGIVTVLGPGTCVITATSLGNGGSLAASSSNYLVKVQAAKKK
jgi:hypothetical protein